MLQRTFDASMLHAHVYLSGDNGLISNLPTLPFTYLPTYHLPTYPLPPLIGDPSRSAVGPEMRLVLC